MIRRSWERILKRLPDELLRDETVPERTHIGVVTSGRPRANPISSGEANRME